MPMSRPVGNHPWKPRAKAQAQIAEVIRVVEEIKSPINVRQAFYRLVVAGLVPKTDTGAKSVSELLSAARRAGLIPWDYIVDESTTHVLTPFYDSPDAFDDVILAAARNYRGDRMRGQKRRPVIISEGRGLLPLIEEVADPYGIEVIGLGGFTSVTFTHDFGERCKTEDIFLLLVADYDPSGDKIVERVVADVSAFAGREVPHRRVALTGDQVVAEGIETAIPKKGDSRTKNWRKEQRERGFDGRSAEAEAIPPNRFREMVEEAILDEIDADAYAEAMEREAEERETVIRRHS